MFGITGSTDGTGPIGFIFGAVGLLAAFGGARMLLSPNMPWAQRIARDLWRMCLALWIAAASFFLGQADEFPEALRIMPLLYTPVLLVLVVMFYWLARVLFTQWRPGTWLMRCSELHWIMQSYGLVHRIFYKWSKQRRLEWRS